MIYVIKAPHMLPDNDALIYKIKIGYSSDEEGNGEKRFKNYKESGLSIRVLFTVPEADIILEQKLHYYFKEYRLDGREWYYCRKEIIDFFEQYKTAEEIDLVLSNKLKLPEKKMTLYDAVKLLDKLKVEDEALISFVKKFYSIPHFTDRTKFYYYELDDLLLENKEERLTILKLVIPNLIFEATNELGSRCKSLSFQRSRLKRGLEKHKALTGRGDLSVLVYSYFDEYTRYPLHEIKEKFNEFYQQLGIKASAKATDIKNFFEVQKVKIKVEDEDKRVDGFLLLERSYGCSESVDKEILDDDSLKDFILKSLEI